MPKYRDSSTVILVICGQTVFPNGSLLTGQKLVKNAKIQKIKCDILGDFQTLCYHLHSGLQFFGVNITEFAEPCRTNFGHQNVCSRAPQKDKEVSQKCLFRLSLSRHPILYSLCWTKGSTKKISTEIGGKLVDVVTLSDDG